LFSCEDISCIRGETILFKDIGFCLQDSALLLLKGPNGSGKTTLLRILSGLMPNPTGQILWDGQPIANNYSFRKELMAIGHKSAVKLDCTVYENLEFWARMHDTQMLIPAALKFFDLRSYQDIPAGQLSAGWQRRVALARLIVAPCRIWLLDEPTNFLDDEAVLLMASLIESRVSQGGIVIAASHIMNSAIAAHTLYINDFNPNISIAAQGAKSDKHQSAERVDVPVHRMGNA